MHSFATTWNKIKTIKGTITADLNILLGQAAMVLYYFHEY